MLRDCYVLDGIRGPPPTPSLGDVRHVAVHRRERLSNLEDLVLSKERLPNLWGIHTTSNPRIVAVHFDSDLTDAHIAELREHIELKFHGQWRLLPGAVLKAPEQPS